jgi:hypothetical protein
MANLLSDAKKQQVIALGQLGWTLRRIQAATGVRRDAYSGEAEHPDRFIVNAPIGDRDRSEATLAGGSAVELALLSP